MRSILAIYLQNVEGMASNTASGYEAAEKEWGRAMAEAIVQEERFDARPWVLLAPALLALLLLMVIPMAIIFVFTFYEYIDIAVDRPAFQFENWRWFFQDSFYHYAIWQTLRI